jgi:hypothetical protein
MILQRVQARGLAGSLQIGNAPDRRYDECFRIVYIALTLNTHAASSRKPDAVAGEGAGRRGTGMSRIYVVDTPAAVEICPR